MSLVVIPASTAQAFSPLDVSPALWLDAADAATITESGGRVSQWNDKSGNSRHATQASGTAQPYTGVNTLNAKNVLTAQAAGQYLTTPSWAHSTTWFAIAVVRQPVAAYANVVALWDTGAYQAFMMKYTNIANQMQVSVYDNTNTPHPVTTGITSGSAFSIIATQYNASNVRLWDGGGVISTTNESFTAQSFTQPMTVFSRGGGSESLIGDIAELVVCEGTLPTIAERGKLFGYLAPKWGITLA